MGFAFALRRFRFLLIIAILIVSGLTVSSFLVRKRARGRPRPLPAKMAAGVDQQMQAFVLSKSSGGQALYTVQASQVTNFKDTGKTLLHNVSIDIFGKKGIRRDHITSPECEVDAAKSTFFLPGEVEMELEGEPGDEASAGDRAASPPVHIVTSGLNFDQNTGIASTEKEVRFRFAGGEGTSQGGMYNPQDRTITMKARPEFTIWRPGSDKDAARQAGGGKKVELGVPAGADGDKLTHVRAASLRFDRMQRKIFLTGPVELAQGSRQVQAGDSEVILDEQQHVQHATLSGPVHGVDGDPESLSEVRASRGEIEFTAQGRVQKIVLDGAQQLPATWATASGQSSKQGQAQRAELYFQEPQGQLSRVHAEGQVRVFLTPVATQPKLPLLPQKPQEPILLNGSRAILAQQADMDLAPDGTTLREVRTRAASTLQIFPSKPGEDKRTVQGERFQMEFGPEGELTEFSAEGNVKFSADATGNAAGRRRVATSDHLWAGFDPRTHAVGRMRQWGHFQYQDPDRQARADQANYAAEGDVVVLEGEPLAWNPTGKLTAQKLSLFNSTGVITAEGKVATTDYPTPSPGNPPPEPVHVIADHLQYNSKTGRAEYQGNARLWQGSDVIEADWLQLDRQQQTLLAHNGVYSIFPGRPDSQNGKPGAAAQAGRTSDSSGEPSDAPGKAAVSARSPASVSGPFEIRSSGLVYKQDEHRAVYQGDVRMQTPSAKLTSGEMEIVFKAPASNQSRPVPDSGGWQIERAIATGDVVIIQPMRKSTGTRAEYIPQESKIILSGNLARVVDAQKGTTQGTRLTYFTGDDRIFVQGEPGSPAEMRRQVKR